MASFTSETASRDARVTDRTLAMFRGICAENCLSDTDAIL